MRIDSDAGEREALDPEEMYGRLRKTWGKIENEKDLHDWSHKRRFSCVRKRLKERQIKVDGVKIYLTRRDTRK